MAKYVLFDTCPILFRSIRIHNIILYMYDPLSRNICIIQCCQRGLDEGKKGFSDPS